MRGYMDMITRTTFNKTRLPGTVTLTSRETKSAVEDD